MGGRGTRTDLLRRGDVMDLLNRIQNSTKPASQEFTDIWEGVLDLPGESSEDPIFALKKKHKLETYRYFTRPFAREVSEEEKDESWYKAHMLKHNELSKLEILDDGEYVFKEWAAQYKGRTFKDIGREIAIAKGDDPDAFFVEGHVYSDMREWNKAHGEYNEGPYVATMEYFATGEGMTYQVISAHAESLAHFILHCAEELGGYYFVIDLDLYMNLEEAKQDEVFNRIVPESAYAFFAKDGYVGINAKYYVNFS